MLTMVAECRRVSVAELLRLLASPRLTVTFFLLTAASALAVAHGLGSATLLMVPPFALLAGNLGAALLTHPRFRADLPLLVFHLALLALVALFAIARLLVFEGQFVLTNGLNFDGHFEKEMRGQLHGDGYRQLAFVNDGFVEHSEGIAGRYRTSTTNFVRWADPDGTWRAAEISDDRPLVLDGYRIYPSELRGFSAFLVWKPTEGAEERGAVNLPPIGSNEFPQGIAWRLADGTELWSMIRTAPPGRFIGDRVNLGASSLDHSLVVWAGEERRELRPGGSATLAGGRITYVALDAWIGYHVVADPTQPWIVATIIAAVGSLVWYYLRRLASRPRERVAA